MHDRYLMRHAWAWLILFALLGAPMLATAQTTVEGTVIDAEDESPLPGVNVTVQNTQIGALTNADGQFTIELPEGRRTLVFSFVGFATQEIDVTEGETSIEVSMEPDVMGLDEVVVTGLASSIKRENLANAVTKIDAEDIAGNVDPSTLDGAMQGKLAGVNITSQSGAPGGGINVQMRGISTLGAGSSQPLYIIDGVYVNNSQISTGRSSADGAGEGNQDNSANRLADLNPDEIQSIEVLKGPSAAAIYGQRANAGVVIITTKRGEAGDTRVNFSQELGAVSALNLLGVASWSEDKIDLIYGEGTDAAARERARFNQAQQNGNLFDYEEELYGNVGLARNTQLEISGGDEQTQFFVAGGLKEEDGIIENTGFARKTVRANIDHRLSDRVRLTSSSNYIYSDSDRGFTGNQNSTGGSVGYTLAYTPTYAQLQPDEDGNFPDNPYFAENPLRLVNEATNNQEVSRFLQSFSLNADLLQSENASLSLDLKGGLDYLNSNSTVYFPPFFQFQQAQSDPGDVIQGKEDNFNTNMQGFLVYNQTLESGAGPFSLTTQGGFTRFTQDENRQLVRGRGLAPGQLNPLNGQTQEIFSQQFVKIVDIGYVGQQEVNWDDRLIGTVGARFDRSTLNANQEEFYFYPKGSLAINLHNFDFWGFDSINQMKLRTAYGETGGLPQFGATFSALNSVNIGGGLGSTISTRGIDPDLDPERSRELELGADISALDGRLALEATYYRKTVDDIILDRENPVSTGITTIATNAGTLRNTGIELGLSVLPVDRENFSWFSRTLFWQNDSEMTDLTIPAFTTGGFGAALGTYYIGEGFSPTTIVGTPATPDSEVPFTVYGDAQPDFQMSFSNSFTLFQDLELSFLFHWSRGGENINLSRFLSDIGGTTDDWNEDHDGDGVPNGLDRTDMFGPGAAQFVEEASYVKLREASIYYTLPSSVLDTAFNGALRNVKLGLSGSNLLLFSDYDSYDPEVSVFGTQAVAQSVEVTPYPSSRRLTFHLRLEY
ncbi:SusC/RagA family protein [Longimonas halophila]|uniref:SusC/RagA family protein n=1 Tax=Longimonas halophila TaxID=1469170 RepID=A0A2H3NNF9_9BACT|nr:SusC/RagA family TonB-linked outer membrane protein [Longimonas halophila]PEN08454.1 SusC/RagA family protein [Longimonas halophila]